MKNCKECRTEFKPKRKEQDYCCRACANIERTRNRENIKKHLKTHTVWSCGGGVQSTAMAVLIIQGKLPKPDFAIMTDCGYEAQYTWEYVYNVLIPELEKAGVTLNIIKTVDYTDNKLFDKQGGLLIPAYMKGYDGKIIKFRTFCNEPLKVRPALKWLKGQGVKSCENWLGISEDEKHRARLSAKKWIRFKYPLVELGYNREKCLWLIGSHGWPQPERTSCVMCPQKTSRDWERIEQLYPSDYQRAREIEEKIRERMPEVYLRRTLQPL